MKKISRKGISAGEWLQSANIREITVFNSSRMLVHRKNVELYQNPNPYKGLMNDEISLDIGSDFELCEFVRNDYR